MGKSKKTVIDHSSLNLDDGTNPHGTTKSNVGLGNVDNTSDLDKPISNATQASLDLKRDAADSVEDIGTAELNTDRILQPDGVGGVQWNASTGELKYRKVYSAERNTIAIGKLAIGNGSSNANMGHVMTQDGKIVAITVSTNFPGSTDTYQAFVNNVAVGTPQVHTGNTSVFNITPIPVVVGDYINAHRLSNGNGGNSTMTIEVEHTVNITGAVKGDQGEAGASSILFGASNPVNPAPADSVYFNTTNGDVYFESGLVWSLEFNTTGPTGATGATGPAGADGADGADGTNGTNGTNGTDGLDGVSIQTSGAGAPVSPGPTQASYLDTSTGDIYHTEAGTTWNFVYNTSGGAVYGLRQAKYTSSTATSVDSTTDVLIPFETQEFQDADFTNTSNTLKTLVNAGRYRVNTRMSVTGTTGNYRWTGEISIRKNGVDIIAKSDGGYIRATSGANYTTIGIDETFVFAANDTIEVLVKRISTTSGNATLVPDEITLELTRMQ